MSNFNWNTEELFEGPWCFRIKGHADVWTQWSDRQLIVIDKIKKHNNQLEIKNDKGNYAIYYIHVTKKSDAYLLAAILSVILLAACNVVLLLMQKRKKRLLKKTHSQKVENISVAVPVTQSKLSEKKENPKSQKYKRVSILFADIQGFTKIVEHMNPEQLIDELDRFFIYFDELVERFNIEKIKTIGDAYMCAGGLPQKNRTNPVEVVLTAMAMQSYVKSMQHFNSNSNFGFWELRIGIHTGSVISGMIGNKKRYFDIWGDSVNIASRMESSGIAGEINITGVTYNMVKDFFVCEYRGKMPIKYKGETDMYFVKGIIPTLSVNSEGKLPNKTFMVRLQHIAFMDFLDYAQELYRSELTDRKWFTSFLILAETVARQERVTEQELLIIKTIAVIVFPQLMEAKSKPVQIDRLVNSLTKFRYTDEQITLVRKSAHHIINNETAQCIEEGVVNDAFILSILRKNFLKSFGSPVSETINKKSVHAREQIERSISKIMKYKPYTLSFNYLSETKPDNQSQALKHFINLNL